MLATMSGSPPPSSLVRVVHSETDGNPFFVEEVYQHLAEEGTIFDEAGRWRTDLKAGRIDVPEGVRLVISRRLERLGDDARRMLDRGGGDWPQLPARPAAGRHRRARKRP